MELFKVTCVTCQAKLSVRNAALIGEIVACPRCESMVLVAEPPRESHSLEPAGRVEQSAPIPPANSDFNKSLADSVEADISGAEVPLSAEVSNVPVNVAVASNKAIVWWIASFAIGASVTGAFLALRHQGELGPDAVAKTQNLGGVESNPSTLPQDSSISLETSEEKTPEDIPDRRNPAAAPHAVPTDKKVDSPPAKAPPPRTAPPQENGGDESLIPSNATATTSPSPKLVVEPPDDSPTARKFDPLRFDLEQMDLANLDTTDESEEVTAASTTVPEEDDPLRAQQPPERPAVVRLSDNSTEQFSSRSAEEQLETKIPSLTVKDVTLADFLALMSSLSGVPISVAPIELQMAGVSPGKRVSLEAQEIRLDEALAKVLEPLHLEATTAGPQAVIVREDAARVRKIDYPIDDLIGDQTTAADYAKWIVNLIAPQSWTRAGGTGTIATTPTGLHIEQAQNIHYQVLFFLERIRLAKQMPLRSRYPARLLGAKPFYSLVEERVTAPTTFTFSHETPLAEVFRYWQSELGLPVFVDWPELAMLDLWPNSRITCRITNEPWHAALDAVLTPLELGWRAGPGGTIQITSQAVVNAESVLDVYPANSWQDKASDEAIIVHDPANELVYVRASAAVHRAILSR